MKIVQCGFFFSAFYLRKRSYCPHFVHLSATASNLLFLGGWLIMVIYGLIESLWSKDLDYGEFFWGGGARKWGHKLNFMSISIFRIFIEIIISNNFWFIGRAQKWCGQKVGGAKESSRTQFRTPKIMYLFFRKCA